MSGVAITALWVQVLFAYFEYFRVHFSTFLCPTVRFPMISFLSWFERSDSFCCLVLSALPETLEAFLKPFSQLLIYGIFSRTFFITKRGEHCRVLNTRLISHASCIIVKLGLSFSGIFDMRHSFFYFHISPNIMARVIRRKNTVHGFGKGGTWNGQLHHFHPTNAIPMSFSH